MQTRQTVGQQLEELLKVCTVKLSIPGKSGWGTGFFVAPGRILTCGHVVRDAGDQIINVCWQNQDNFAEATIDRAYPDPIDLALLRIKSPPNHPCVYLETTIHASEVVEADDCLYTYGYPDDFPAGAPVTDQCEGLTGDEYPIIKFKAGQIRPGLSGSPLLNQRTRRICGVVKFTRDRSLDLGGGAIPSTTILSQFQELADLQTQFHKKNRRWYNLLPFARCSLRNLGLISAGVTAFVVLIRFLGMLQPLELAAYDQLIRLRPDEKPDSRLLIVTISRSDMAAQTARGEKLIGSLSNESLQKLLEKLDSWQPRAVGLDIYRDGVQPPNLLTRFQQPDLFAICKVNYDQAEVSGIKPPSGVTAERIGFSDFVVDDDDILRRHLLAFQSDSTSPCTTETSFSLRLAGHYLKQQNISYQNPITPEGYCQNLQFSNGVSFKNFQPYTGGYQGEQNYGGCQVLLNYRSHQQVAEQFTLEQVLNGTVPAEKFKDRIVLIGIAHRDTSLDYWSTPYGAKDDRQIPGGSGSSLDGKSNPQRCFKGKTINLGMVTGGELLWIGLWSLVGGILGRQLRLLRHLGMAQGIALFSLFGVCLTVFQVQSGWLPLIPPGLVLILTGVGAWWSSLRLTMRNNNSKRK